MINFQMHSVDRRQKYAISRKYNCYCVDLLKLFIGCVRTYSLKVGRVIESITPEQ